MLKSRDSSRVAFNVMRELCMHVFALVCYTKIKEQANNVEENKKRKAEKIKKKFTLRT